jgi:hypothetical protein
MRGNLYLLKQPGVVTLLDREGNLIRPTDEERDSRIREIEAFLRENCE